jgi:SAM-dependent methyltransferase
MELLTKGNGALKVGLPAQLQGWVDTFTIVQISGWAHDPDRPNQPLELDIIVNDEKIANLKARIFRPDLKMLGYGDGRKGFSFNPLFYLQGGENRVRICYAGTNEALMQGDRTLLKVEGFETIDGTAQANLLGLSQSRWREQDEDQVEAASTLTGDAFLDAVQEHHTFSGSETILEVGPGLGRLLSTLLQRRLPFGEYWGLELSAARVQRLKRRFQQPGVRFIQADVMTEPLGVRADVVICSSTFEHLFPSMTKALQNLRAMTSPGAKLFIDFAVNDRDDDLQTSRAYFESSTAYIRIYTRSELESLFIQEGYSVRAIAVIVLGKDRSDKQVRRALVAATRE